MATDTLQHPEPAASSAAPRGLAFGLAWAGAMVLLAALWLSRKYTLPAFYPILLVLVGVGFLALSAWHGWTLWKACRACSPAGPEAPANAAATDGAIAGQVGLISSYIAAAGVFLGVSGGYFLWMHGLKAVADGGGLILFGLAALGASWMLKARPHAEGSSVLAYVERHANHVGKMLLALAGAVLVVYWALFWNGIAGRHIFPELLGLGLLVLLLAGVGAFLTTAEQPLSSISARIVVLVLGSLFGFCLFVTVIGRTIAWRDSTIFGGLAAWQGEQSWRLWLCAYAGTVALAIMTASLLLARTDIRASAALRRVFFGFNVGVTALLLLLVLAILNIVGFALVPYQFDWTSSRGVYSLAESSKRLLDRLGKETTVYVILPKSRDTYQELYTFLENCQAHSPKFKFKHWSQEFDRAELERLARQFPAHFEDLPAHGITPRRRGLLVVYGELPADPEKKVPHAFIKDDAIFETDARNPKRKGSAITHTFHGELEVMKALSSFAAERKSRVYFLQDNGELDINATDAEIRADRFSRPMADSGGSRLKKYLAEENFDVAGLSFAEPRKLAKTDLVYAPEDGATKKKRIPADAEFLIIAGPSRAMGEDALTALDEYLERGGKLLAFFDIVTDLEGAKMVNTGLEEVLRKHGVDVTNDYVIAVAERRPLDMPMLAPVRKDNELITAFQRKPILFSTARVLRKGPPGKYEVETLLEANPLIDQFPDFLIETDLRNLKNPLNHLRELAKSKSLVPLIARTPVPTALYATPMGSKDRKPQVYVFGDTDFISDSLLQRMPPIVQELHLDLVRSCLAHASERPGLVGPKARTVTNYIAQPETNFAGMVLVPGWVMALSLIGLGGGLWLIRRR